MPPLAHCHSHISLPSASSLSHRLRASPSHLRPSRGGGVVRAMRLYIVRHGDPDYSVDGLTPAGKEEAAALGIHFSKLLQVSH